MKRYDDSNIQSIYDFAKDLKFMTFRDILNDRIISEKSVNEDVSIYEDEEYISKYENSLRKGGMGDFVEKVYFDIDNNSESRPDFYKVGLELKVTPFKRLKNKNISAKERLVISMINYNNIVSMDFYTSNLWHKIEKVLMVFYLWEKDVPRIDYRIFFIHMYEPSEADLSIIKEDFYLIKQKVMDGKAHELSEGDTYYVGACTKSSSSSVLVSQPFSDIEAKPRAFSFKSSYMTFILRNYINPDKNKLDSIIKNKNFGNFEDYIISLISKYYNKTDEELFRKFDIKSKSKQRYSMLVLKMLGVNTENAEEFEKANIEIKTIRHKIGKKPREHMSFPEYNIKKLVETKWEDSDIYNKFNEVKFLFVEFVENNQGYVLYKAKFWNMPKVDIDSTLRSEWELYRDIYSSGVIFTINDSGRVSNSLPKSKDTRILHSRPHANRAAYYIKSKNISIGDLEKDADTLPNGDKMTKQSFWLNNTYIFDEIINKD